MTLRHLCIAAPLLVAAAVGCTTTYVAPPLVAGTASSERRLPVGFVASENLSGHSELSELVFSPGGSHVAWLVRSERMYGGPSDFRNGRPTTVTTVREGRARVVVDGIPDNAIFFDAKGLRFLADGPAVVYAASSVVDNRQLWGLMARGLTVAAGQLFVHEVAARDDVYAATVSNGRGMMVAVNGRIAAERYGRITGLVVAAKTHRVLFAGRNDASFRIYEEGVVEPLSPEFADLLGPVVDGDAVYFAGANDGQWAVYKNGQKLAGGYRAMRSLVAKAGSFAYAAEEKDGWSVFTFGQRRAANLLSVAEVALSPSGKHVAWAADRGDGFELFVDGRSLSAPLAYVNTLSFAADDTTVVALGSVGRGTGLGVEERRRFVMVNGQRVTSLFSGEVAYATGTTALHYAGFDTWDEAVVLGECARYPRDTGKDYQANTP